MPAKIEYVTSHMKIDYEVINASKDSWTIIEPVWWTANIYDGEQRYNQSLASFSQQQRHLFAITWYIAEVDNGGHDQFYYNSTGIVWQDALAGFRELEVDEAAAIIEESAARMGGNPSLDRETRQQQLDALNPDFEDLDTRLYKLEATMNLDELMYQYIRKNRNAFYFEGDVQKPNLPNK